MFIQIRKIELEIQTINDNSLDVDHPSMKYIHICVFFPFIQLLIFS